MGATEGFLKGEIKTLVDKLRDKEEEIKKLKSDLSLVIKERDDNIEQNKKLKDDLLSYIRREEDLREQNKKLKEENEKLKEKLLFYKGRWKQNKFGGWYFEVKKPKDIQN